MISKNDSLWLEHFQVLVRYMNVYDRFPAEGAVFEECAIGEWFYNQVAALQNGELAEDRKEVLDRFQPGWERNERNQILQERMRLNGDWKAYVPEGDVALDSVLEGEVLEALVSMGIYGCKQYLCHFEEVQGPEPWVGNVRFALRKGYGAEAFSLENRKRVFEQAFPRVSFEAFNVLYGAFYREPGGLQDWGFTKDDYGYVTAAAIYQVRSPFGSARDMREAMDSLIGSMGGWSKQRMPDVLWGKYYNGKMIGDMAEEMDVSSSKLYQVEADGLRKLRHGRNVRGFRPLTFEEMLRMGRGNEVPAGCVENGSLDLSGSFCDGLPDGLVVEGFLDLEDSLIDKLPDGLVVKGFLNLAGTKVRGLPEGLVVEGDLILASEVDIPSSVVIKGEVCRVYKQFGVNERQEYLDSLLAYAEQRSEETRLERAYHIEDMYL